MSRRDSYTTMFVEYMPEQLEDGVLYVAPHFECAMHKCMCGCGEKVVTPLCQGGWKWSYDGVTRQVSLEPSIGNFQFPCRSHYYLKYGKVMWCG